VEAAFFEVCAERTKAGADVEPESGGGDEAPLGALDDDAGLEHGEVLDEGELDAGIDAERAVVGGAFDEQGDLAVEGHGETLLLLAALEVELVLAELEVEHAGLGLEVFVGAGVGD